MRQQALESLHRLAPHLWKRGREVIARLELLSSGTTSSVDTDSSKGAFGSRVPVSGDRRPLFLAAIERLAGAKDASEVAQAVDWAEKRLREAVKGDPGQRPEGESQADRAVRIVEEGEGYSLLDAAQHFRVPTSEVKSARFEAGRFIGDGKALPNGAPSQRHAAHALKRSGLTQAQIAKQLQVSQPTVSRLLGDRAA